MLRVSFCLIVLLVATVVSGCGTAQVPATAFSRDAAIQRATLAARQSAPEVGILEARVDSVTAELITLAEADRRMGGERGASGYAPGQMPETPVWWVTVHGYFRYNALSSRTSTSPVYEAHERGFIYDARTGDEVGERVPWTQLAPTLPPPTPSPTPTLAPGAFVETLPAPATSLAVDPRDSQTVYALLETNALFRSTNRGQTWQRLFFPATERPYDFPLDPQNRNVIFMFPQQDLRFASAEPDRIFVLADSTLYRSDDRGVTWQPIQDHVTAWTVASADGNSLYVARGLGLPREEYGIYHSDDSGKSWQERYAGFFPPFLKTEPFIPNDEGITGLLTDLSAPKTLYAGTYFGIYRSRDAGKTWDALNAGLPPTQRVYRWVRILIAAGDNIFALTDVVPDINSYQTIVVQLHENGWVVAAAFPYCADNACNIETLVADPTDSKRLYLGTRQGLLVSDDVGSTWRSVALPVAGAVYRVAIAPSEPTQLYLWTDHGFVPMTIPRPP